MKTMLEKWLLFFGVLLFCLFVIPELKASAAEIPDEVHAAALYFSYGIDNYVLLTDSEGDYYCLIEISKNSTYARENGPFDVDTYTNSPYRYVLHDGKYGIVSPSWWTQTVGKYVDGSFVQFDTAINSETSCVYRQVEGLTFQHMYHDVPLTIVYSSKDIINSEDGSVFFQHPLPPVPTPSLQQRFQTAVEMTNLEAVMSQVVGLAPLLIGLLTTLIGFSKGLRLLFQTLQRV